jgi:serine/threonine protein kinase
MGEIFLAKLGEIQGFEKPIVIKKILPQLARDQEFLQRFIEEAQIAIKLTHGNIVPVYEVGMVGGEYFLALQYIEGRDLRTMVNRARERGRRLPPDLCLYLVREITNGLAYAHRRTDDAGHPLELVHCDISPPNVLVSFEGEVKIIDFGIAKSAMQRAQANEEVGFGKFGYMAPEQLLRGATVDRRTDIYSTGVLLYELLTGQRLFNFPPGVDYRQVAREVTAGSFAPPSERDLKLGDTLDNLVMRALRTEKKERYQTAEEFRDAIQQHLYRMNPSISADVLALFVGELFKGEIETDRHTMRSLSATDLQPFRDELQDASSHTVSYALGGVLSQTSGSGLLVVPPQRAPRLAPPARLPSTGPELPALPPATAMPAARPSLPPRPKASGTRRLSEEEQRAAARIEQSGGHAVSKTIAVPLSRRWVISGGLGLVAVVGIGVALALVVPRLGGEASPPDAGGARLPDARAAAREPTRPDLAPSSRPVADARASADAAAAAAPDQGFIFRPEVVKIRKPDRKKKKAAKKAPEVTPAQVQAKFRQVRGEYQAFTRAYGRRLDQDWQQILFANTYGTMDQGRYQRLNEMLDVLRRKMREVREGTGG